MAVLRPGGLLAIELPDPECHWAKLLGRWWMPWLQPQHLNLMPIGNLRAEPAGRGFTVVAEQRAEPHAAIDVLAASIMAVNALTIAGEDLPWRDAPPTRWRRAMFIVCVPLFVLASVADRISAPFGRQRGWSNVSGGGPPGCRIARPFSHHDMPEPAPSVVRTRFGSQVALRTGNVLLREPWIRPARWFRVRSCCWPGRSR